MRETPPEQVKTPRLLTGNDLSDMGYSPGPEFRIILAAVEDAQLEGNLSSKEEAKAFVSANYPIAKIRRIEDGVWTHFDVLGSLAFLLGAYFQ